MDRKLLGGQGVFSHPAARQLLSSSQIIKQPNWAAHLWAPAQFALGKNKNTARDLLRAASLISSTLLLWPGVRPFSIYEILSEGVRIRTGSGSDRPNTQPQSGSLQLI